VSAVLVPVLWLYDPSALEQSQGKSAIGWDGAQCVIVFSSTDGEDVASDWVEAAIPGAVLTFCRVEAAWQDAGETARILRANNRNWPGLP
jgi:hypothetical protein